MGTQAQGRVDSLISLGGALRDIILYTPDCCLSQPPSVFIYNFWPLKYHLLQGLVSNAPQLRTYLKSQQAS